MHYNFKPLHMYPEIRVNKQNIICVFSIPISVGSNNKKKRYKRYNNNDDTL